MHKPSGLGIYAMYAHEEAGGGSTKFLGGDQFFNNGPQGFNPVTFQINTPDTDVYYVKPFWRKVWSMNGVAWLARSHHDLR